MYNLSQASFVVSDQSCLYICAWNRLIGCMHCRHLFPAIPFMGVSVYIVVKPMVWAVCVANLEDAWLVLRKNPFYSTETMGQILPSKQLGLAWKVITQSIIQLYLFKAHPSSSKWECLSIQGSLPMSSWKTLSSGLQACEDWWMVDPKISQYMCSQTSPIRSNQHVGNVMICISNDMLGNSHAL